MTTFKSLMQALVNWAYYRFYSLPTKPPKPATEPIDETAFEYGVKGYGNQLPNHYKPGTK